jgi:hypothetical protein
LKHCLLLFSIALLFSNSSWAFKNNASYVGLGIYSQNILSRVSSKDDGTGSFAGSNSYPLLLKHDWGVFGDWFFSPQITYTLMPRSSAEDSAKTTIMHVMFPYGKNAGSGGGQGWDWFVGPGIIRYEIKGAGGTTVMSNGTGTATFALPGRSAVIQNITLNTGVGYGFGGSKVSADLIIENMGSTGKRAESLMMSYAYNFGGN